MSLQDLDNLPGVTAQPDAATRNFVFNHTMLFFFYVSYTTDI